MGEISLTHAGLSLLAGALTTLSPCVFPLLPLVVGGALQASRVAPLVMGVGMATTFALIGASVGAFGAVLGLDGDGVRQFGALVLIALALVFWIPALDQRFARLMLPLASGAHSASSRLDGGSISGAFVLGSVLGLVWSPCAGPLLGAALTLVASEGGALRGLVLLGLFGLGAATPLVAVAYASRTGFSFARGWVLAHVVSVKKAFGLLLAAFGFAILTGADKWLEARVLDGLPDAWAAVSVSL